MAELIWVKGTMNCGKSGNIIMLNDACDREDRNVVIFKSVLDTRDGSKVWSRALSTTLEAISIGLIQNNQMYNYVRDNDVDVVLVDEVQFFSKEQIFELLSIVRDLNVNVVVYGLVTNYQNDLFDAGAVLTTIADHVVELVTFCVFCNNRAKNNLRVEDGRPVFTGEVIRVGGNEMYKAVCLDCFLYAKRTGELPKKIRRVVTSSNEKDV